uniref:non-specific serine/threonine protein kinase n=1 Tax=Angiostrongylus cantonensis TaxID=6313 RepID=A0A0K0DNY8_ANGCA
QNYTHADIKAANILLERPNDFSSCVLVDYGLARMSSSNEDRPLKQRAHNGTPLFTSCDAHRGCHPSYRGDLEILAYNIMYWLNGSLPWQVGEKYGSID